MTSKPFGAASLLLGLLLGSGCLRLVDEPLPAGATGTTCEKDSECHPGTHCLGAPGGGDYQGECGEVGVCDSHAQCEKNERCLSDHCQVVACTGEYDESDTICGAYECDDKTYSCRNNCQTDAQCSRTNVCRGGACLSPKCTTENAALVCEGYACDVVLGHCGNFCTQGAMPSDCATGYTCNESFHCAKICDLSSVSSTQCGSNKCKELAQYPPPSIGVCAQFCTQHTDCLNGTVCINSRCVVQMN